MSQSNLTPSSRWNPNQVRRCVRFAGETNDGIAQFVTKSFTSTNAADKYHPCVDMVTGEATCDCPHFEFRLAKHHPKAADTELLCKHLIKAVGNIKRHGIDL